MPGSERAGQSETNYGSCSLQRKHLTFAPARQKSLTCRLPVVALPQKEAESDNWILLPAFRYKQPRQVCVQCVRACAGVCERIAETLPICVVCAHWVQRVTDIQISQNNTQC